MSDKIIITGVRAHGKHGVLDREKVEPQEFVVDATLKLDLAAAAKSDDLAKSVSYEDVAVLIHRVITGPSRNLIETLAGELADSILELSKKIEAVEVTVHKPSAPISVAFGDVAVSIKRDR